MSYKHDFGEIKARFTIEKVAELLGIEMKLATGGFRAECPCGRGNHRSLSITPSRQSFYCFGSREHGDCIQLVAHARGCEVKEAAEWLDGIVPSKRDNTRNQSPPKGDNSLTPLDYLEHDHPAVIALGFEPEDAKALGVGFAGRGTMAGHVLLPLHVPGTSELAGYVAIDDLAKLPKKWHGIPSSVVVPLRKPA